MSSWLQKFKVGRELCNNEMKQTLPPIRWTETVIAQVGQVVM